MNLLAVQLKEISVKISNQPILTNISLEVVKGECLALLGPSGSGKTTLLRVIAGLIIPNMGQVKLFGKDVTEVLPEHREVSMLFQDPVLFPHLTVEQNARIGLTKEKRKLTTDFRIKHLKQHIAIDECSDRKINSGLSGGEKQRAALLRTFVNAKDLLLLDEPLKSSLNVDLRWKLLPSIKQYAKEDKRTSIIVTHDFEEAAFFADKIAVLLNNGKEIFIGETSEMYLKPKTLDVARLLGKGTEISADTFFKRDERERLCPFIFEDGEPPIVPDAETIYFRPNKIKIKRDGVGFIIKSISFFGEYSLVEIVPKNGGNINNLNIFVSCEPSLFTNKDLNKEIGAVLLSDSILYFDKEKERISDN